MKLPAARGRTQRSNVAATASLSASGRVEAYLRVMPMSRCPSINCTRSSGTAASSSVVAHVSRSRCCRLGLDGSLLTVGVAPVTFPVHLPRPVRRSRRPGFSVPSRLSDVMAPNKGSCLWATSCQPSTSAKTSSVLPFLPMLPPVCAFSKRICHWISTRTPFSSDLTPRMLCFIWKAPATSASSRTASMRTQEAKPSWLAQPRTCSWRPKPGAVGTGTRPSTGRSGSMAASLASSPVSMVAKKWALRMAPSNWAWT